jgi:hypothetical protein
MSKIYALIDPNTNLIRYVGKTDYPLEFRLKQHCSKKSKTHKWNWIKGLMQNNQKPVISLIEDVSEDMWQERECYWIGRLRAEGASLTNIENGGKGGRIGISLLSEESKQKLRTARKNQIAPMLGKHHTEETKAKLREKRKSYIPTVETRTKISLAQTGRKNSEISKLKVSDSLKQAYREGRIQSKRYWLGKKRPLDTGEKIRKALLGRKASPEARESLKKAWVIRKASHLV